MEPETLGGDLECEQVPDLLEEIPDRHRARIQPHLAGLQFREIEDIIHHREQGLAVCDDLLHIAFRLRWQA